MILDVYIVHNNTYLLLYSCKQILYDTYIYIYTDDDDDDNVDNIYDNNLIITI